MKMSTTVSSVALAIALSAGMPAVAGLSEASITSPGGFVQAGAYQSTCGCWAIPGTDMTVTYGLGQDFHEQGFSGDSAAQQSGSASNGRLPVADSARAFDARTATCGVRPPATPPARP